MDVRNLLEQAKELERRLRETDELLKAHETHGSAADGAVNVRVNGAGDVTVLQLDPQWLAGVDAAQATAAILAALCQATAASRSFRDAERARLSGGLQLPDF